MMKKVLVTGGNGQLGSELKLVADQASDIQFHFIDIDDLDLLDFDAVTNYFQEHSFDFVVNCAAYTAVDLAESEQEMADKINHSVPKKLAEVCNEHHLKLIHISTDFVFGGDGNTPIEETETPKPLSVYGETKLKGDLAIQAIAKGHYIIRTSWLYSRSNSNFVSTIINLCKNRDEINVVYDQIGAPTNAADLAEVIAILVRSENVEYGIYHYSNQGLASWYDFAVAIVRIKNIQTKVRPILSSQFKTKAARPKYSLMDKSKIEKNLNIKIPHWYESLEKCLTLEK